ncbi:MAG TPA: hypothetical protein VJS92_08780 [Candidatus Polarisedimenticolaceae bacterium]|nr:hypothetical protein [Candidatus Polarisedimenticolaceae bacterium]
MEREAIFASWAPEDALWSPWAKPVLFTQLTEADVAASEKKVEVLPVFTWLPLAASGTALILDLPGSKSLDVGMTVARAGYRPVPLFNGVPGSPREFVLTRDIMRSLASFSNDLDRIGLAPDAPPAFLLDSDRMASGRIPKPGDFDNRWMVFPQDFPSGAFLRRRGLERVLIVRDSAALPEDLIHVGRGFRRAGLTLLVKALDDEAPPQEAVLSGSWIRSVFFRALVMFRLRRSSAGGFGSTIPEPRRVGFVG